MTNFAAIRLLAASAVVLGHAFVLAGAAPPVLLGLPIHVLAVRVFFVVSGYLVCGSWLRDPHLPRFAARRLLRIMPGLAAVTLLSAAILGPALTTLPWRTYVGDPQTAAYLWNLALAPRFALPGVFDDGRVFTAVNGSLWSLPVEVAMYALLPLYATRRARLRWLLLPFAAAAIGAAICFTVVWPNQVQPVLWDTSLPFALRFAADFVVGAAVFLFAAERCLSRGVALAVLALAELCGLFAGDIAGALTASLALPYAVLAFALSPRPLFGALDRRADMSYGIYLWGGPIQQVVVSMVGAGVGWAALAGLAAPAILACAALSWFLVERPALAWRPTTPAAARRTPFTNTRATPGTSSRTARHP